MSPLSHFFAAVDETFLSIRIKGCFLDEQVRAQIQEILGSRELKGPLRVLGDYRGVESAASPELVDDVLSRLRECQEVLQAARIALVSDFPAAFGMGRMFENLSHALPLEVRVFRDLEEARSWLGMEDGCPSCGHLEGREGGRFVTPAVGNLPALVVLECARCGHRWSRPVRNDE